jgi:hypothetical protein
MTTCICDSSTFFACANSSFASAGNPANRS